jgi:uncharacterized SAM-binding protein YcdF (DUF218 family)
MMPHSWLEAYAMIHVIGHLIPWIILGLIALAFLLFWLADLLHRAKLRIKDALGYGKQKPPSRK